MSLAAGLHSEPKALKLIAHREKKVISNFMFVIFTSSIFSATHHTLAGYELNIVFAPARANGCGSEALL